MLIPSLSRFLARWRAARALHRNELALRALDERTLRDLGLTRSELLSWAHEDAGAALPTRRRVRAGTRASMPARRPATRLRAATAKPAAAH